jgi:uncharacterized membrane protein
MLTAVVVDSSVQSRSVGVRWARDRSLTISASLSIRLVTAAYAVVFGAAGVLDYVGYRSASYDLGTAAQAVWTTAHGRFLEWTAVNGEQVSRLGWHVDPLLALFTPVWLIWSSPVILVVVKAAAVSAGALPVYWLARKHLGSERAATYFALAYLAYPATQWNALDPNLGFHPVNLALPLLLYALWWLDEERWVRFGAVAVLAAASNEHIPVIVGCFGLWYGVTRRRPVAGAAIFGTGLAITAVEFLFIVPHFNPAGSNPYVADRYGAVGGTTAGILETLVLHPLRVAEIVFTGHKLGYLALLFVPLLGLCFRAPLLLVGAIPPLAINLLSASRDQSLIGSHYAASTAAVLFGAAIIGTARTAEPERFSRAVLGAVALIAFISPFWTAVPVAREAVMGSSHFDAQRHAVRLIPNGVPVSASNILGAHLSARRRILLFPAIRDADWIAVDTADTEGASSFRAVVQRLTERRRFATVYESNGVVVMRRTPPGTRATSKG